MTMKSIGETLKANDFLSRRHAQETQKTLDPASVNIVNRLFVFFESICRGFEKQYHGHSQKKLNMEKIQWARGFMDSGITRIEQIEFGIKRCRLESPVNTPRLGEFLKWCTPSPEDLGMPRLDDAYDEACRNSSPSNPEKKWTHKAVYHAWTMCSSYDLSHLPKINTYPVFERNYDITVKMIMRGEPLKDIPAALTHDEDSVPRENITKGFENCNSRRTAMEAISRMLR